MFEHHEDILTVPDVAETLYIGKNRVYELLQSGELKGFRIGRIWKIPKESIIEYIRTNANLN